MYKIAVIEDVQEVNDSLAGYCRQLAENVEVDQFLDRESAEEAIVKNNYSLIVLDIELAPDRNAGFGIVKVNSKNFNSPVIVVSGLDHLVYKSIMLELDVWDYLVKPVAEPIEFIDSALRVLHRVSKARQESNDTVADFYISQETGKAYYKKKALNIPHTAKMILQKIYSAQGAVVAYDDMYCFVKSGRNPQGLQQHFRTIRVALQEVDADGNIDVVRMKGARWQE